MKFKIILVSILFTGLANIARCQQNSQTIAQQIESLLSSSYDKGLFSGQVIVSRNGERIYSKEFGFANWNTKKAVTNNTLFNIGSLNKKFTQEIIRQLVEEKKLSYESNLNSYLNLFSGEAADKITIRQLLDMRAGLADFLQDPHYFKYLMLKDFSTADLMEIIKNEPLLFEPGTDQKYSNSGYAVLGAVIEKVTKKSYEENLKERIAKPLGLQNIYYTKAEILEQINRATGTNIDLDGSKKSIEAVANSTAAGGLYATADDLLKFTEAKLLHGPGTNEVRGIPLFAGGSPGWSSAVSYNEKNGYVIAVLANIGDDIAVKITKRINSIINGEPFPPLDQSSRITFYKLITEKGYDYIKNNAKDMAAQQRLPYDDHFLNDVANEFLLVNKPDVAINLYKINAELFPGSIYTYDVLAQTFLKTGDKNNALKYFKTLLSLDPDNQRVKKLVAELESAK